MIIFLMKKCISLILKNGNLRKYIERVKFQLHKRFRKPEANCGRGMFSDSQPRTISKTILEDFLLREA